MAKTKYTMLGMSSAGKSCYITAMYMKMSFGFDGFTLTTDDKTRTKLERDIRILRNPSGQDRFPAATNETSVRSYEFKLNYNTKKIIDFEIYDYAGGVLVSRDNTYAQIKQSITESTVLYIFIDGKSLCSEDREERKENVIYDCAMTITPIIQDFADTHNKVIPPIVFVVTKADLCKKYVTNEEIITIIKELFSPAFADGTNSYICAVSLGDSISDKDYTGKFKPVNIHIPSFIGSYHEYYNRCVILKHDVNNLNKKLELEKENNNIMADKEERKIFFRDRAFIERCRETVEKADRGQKSNQTVLDNAKELYYKFSSELERESEHFDCFINGIKQESFRAFKI